MTKRFGYIVAAITVALSAIGIGYAAWYQNLSITGTINTGSLSAYIILDTPPFDSSSEFTSISEGESTETNLVVNIENAFPGNSFTVNYLVVSTSSIPAEISIGESEITPNGTGATASDITIIAPTDSQITPPGTAISGSITITVNDSVPDTGEASYSISIPVIVSPPIN
jgi:hypothetical protein